MPNVTSIPERLRRHVTHGEAMEARHWEDGHQCPRERSEEEDWRHDLARFAAVNVTGHRVGQIGLRATDPEYIAGVVAIHQAHLAELPLDAA